MQFSASVRALLKDFLALFIPFLVIFCFPSIDLLTRNVKYFGFDLSISYWVILVGLMVFFVGSVAAFFKRDYPILEVLFLFIVILGPFWLVYTTISPYIGKELSFPVITVGALLSGWVLQKSRRLKVLLPKAFGILTLLLLLVLAVEIIELNRVSNKRSSETAFFAKFNPPIKTLDPVALVRLPNIFHIVFDEFQSDMFSAVLTDKYKKELGGFIFFPNASTSAVVFTRAPLTVRSSPRYETRQVHSPARA